MSVGGANPGLPRALRLHYNALHMDDQLTFRIPRGLSRALNRSARERGVPKSQLVREALREYLGAVQRLPPGEAWKRLARYKGIAPLDEAAIEADPIARQIRDHNWRQ